jgi:hypothetical protein
MINTKNYVSGFTHPDGTLSPSLLVSSERLAEKQLDKIK